jgi:hypothetical protein
MPTTRIKTTNQTPGPAIAASRLDVSPGGVPFVMTKNAKLLPKYVIRFPALSADPLIAPNHRSNFTRKNRDEP